MKSPDRMKVSRLEDLPNIGKASAADLRLLGIKNPQQLIQQDPLKLYQKLCQITRSRHDPCVIDVFMAAVDYMQGGEARPWWAFTEQRKLLIRQKV